MNAPENRVVTKNADFFDAESVYGACLRTSVGCYLRDLVYEVELWSVADSEGGMPSGLRLPGCVASSRLRSGVNFPLTFSVRPRPRLNCFLILVDMKQS